MTKILWVDIEGSGLDPVDDIILEVGLRITDLDGETLDQITTLVWQPDWRSKVVKNEFVFDMHVKSGLVDDLSDLDKYGAPANKVMDIEKILCTWIDQRINTAEGLWPMAGNSVHYDRGFLAHHMPSLLTRWHYRNLDVSSMREACRMLSPSLFGKMPTPTKAHRPQGDLDESIKLWRWLADNFFWTEIGEDGSANGG